MCGFRKAHSSQYDSFELLASWQTLLSKSGFVVSIVMDLSKAYDCLKDDLMLAKCQAYGVSKNV